MTIEGSIPWMAPEVRCTLQATILQGVVLYVKEGLGPCATTFCKPLRPRAYTVRDTNLQPQPHAKCGFAAGLIAWWVVKIEHSSEKKL